VDQRGGSILDPRIVLLVYSRLLGDGCQNRDHLQPSRRKKEAEQGKVQEMGASDDLNLSRLTSAKLISTKFIFGSIDHAIFF
jgi:hypothetical protein